MPKKRLKPSEPLLSAAEVARQLHVDVRTVHRMVADGRLKPVQKMPGLRGAYLFDAASIKASA